MGILDAPAVSKSAVVRIAGLQVGSSRGTDNRRIGPIATDVTSVVQTSTPDGTLVSGQYLVNNSSALPANYPVEFGMATMNTTTNAFGYIEAAYPNFAGHFQSFYTDAPKIAVKFGYATSSYAYQVFIDGAPVTLDPVVGNGLAYLTMIFPTGGKARLIQIYTRSGIGTIYMAAPYRAWKPKPQPSPRVFVMGDSYAMTTSFDAAGASIPYEFGIYHRMSANIGAPNMGVDGIGNTGYISRNATTGFGGPNNNYADRLASAVALAPDVLIVHGGGANDLSTGSTTAQIITAATTFFQTARASLPDAKLVFVEGFTPPSFQTQNTNYITISSGLRTALTATGVYYIDVATTAPWIDGTGFFGNRVVTDGATTSGSTTLTSATAAFVGGDVGVYITGSGIPANTKISSVTNATTVVLSAAATITATAVSVTITHQTGVGNSDIYIGPDSTHLIAKGSDYIRYRMADKIRTILNDNGALLNTLV